MDSPRVIFIAIFRGDLMLSTIRNAVIISDIMGTAMKAVPEFFAGFIHINAIGEDRLYKVPRINKNP